MLEDDLQKIINRFDEQILEKIDGDTIEVNLISKYQNLFFFVIMGMVYRNVTALPITKVKKLMGKVELANVYRVSRTFEKENIIRRIKRKGKYMLIKPTISKEQIEKILDKNRRIIIRHNKLIGEKNGSN